MPLLERCDQVVATVADDWVGRPDDEQGQHGWVRSKASGYSPLIYLGADRPWQGRLHFDTPRHREVWKMPLEYPRLNGSPEWFVVDRDATYQVEDLDTGQQATYSGAELADGLEVSLGAEGGASTDRAAVHWKVVGPGIGSR